MDFIYQVDGRETLCTDWPISSSCKSYSSLVYQTV